MSIKVIKINKNQCISRLAEILALFQEAYPDDDLIEEDIVDYFCKNKNKNTTILLQDKGVIIAAGSIELTHVGRIIRSIYRYNYDPACTDPYDKKYICSLDWIAVKKEYRKKGIGTSIVYNLEKNFPDTKKYLMALDCGWDEVPFYKKAGFDFLGGDQTYDPYSKYILVKDRMKK